MSDNTLTYPGIERVKDPATRDSLQLIWSRIHMADKFMKGPIRGTLDPDTKPRGLKVGDTGTRFFAFDYNRVYVWDGAGWADEPGQQPARGGVLWLAEGESPGNGWVRATGATAQVSTPDGKVSFQQVKNVSDIVGQKAWVRV